MIVFVQYGSWSYDGLKLDLHFYEGLEAIDLTEYYEYGSGEWDLLEHNAKKYVQYVK